MATVFKCSVLLCLMLVLKLTMQQQHAGILLAECGVISLEFQNRKFLMEMKSENGFNSNNGKNEMAEMEELSRVPAGPHPLHHHSQDPQPNTP